MQKKWKQMLTGVAAFVMTTTLAVLFALEGGAMGKGCSGSVVPCTGDAMPSYIFFIIGGVVIVAAMVVLVVLRKKGDNKPKVDGTPGPVSPADVPEQENERPE